MSNLAALRLMVSENKVFKDFENFKFSCYGNHSFLRNQILLRKFEEDHGRNISVKFHQNRICSFREEDV